MSDETTSEQVRDMIWNTMQEHIGVTQEFRIRFVDEKNPATGKTQRFWIVDAGRDNDRMPQHTCAQTAF